jgi:hypothetical protein
MITMVWPCRKNGQNRGIKGNITKTQRKEKYRRAQNNAVRPDTGRYQDEHEIGKETPWEEKRDEMFLASTHIKRM